jgi:hypothetical protein
MKHNLASVALLALAVLAGSLYAVERRYEKGAIVDVEKKFHTRVLYYLVNSPVTQDDPYYQVSLQLNNTLYLTEYEPRHAAETLPEDWKPGTEVQMAFTDKRHVLVKKPGGQELQLIVVKRTAGAPEAAGPKPASPKP